MDNCGYDLIAEENGVVRHIQLKAGHLNAKAASQKVHAALFKKPSGCIVWIFFHEETLELGPFLFFGDKPGKALPHLSQFRVARHTKGNAAGVKAERPGIRVIPKAYFHKYASVDAIYNALFLRTSRRAGLVWR